MSLKLNVVSSATKLLVLVMLLALSACGSSGVEVTTFLGTNANVDKGTLVYFEDKPVGHVSDVVNEPAGTRLAISIDGDAAKSISRQAAIVLNTIKTNTPLEIYNPSNPSGEALIAGQEINGLGSMFQLGAWMVGDAIQIGKGSVNDYMQSFQDYFEGDGFTQDQAALQNQIAEASDVATDVIKTLEDELSNAAADMSMTEQELAATMQELGDELAPVVEELSQRSTELMIQLEKFAQGLENTTPEQRETGEKFLQSLEQTIEQLNEAIESGVEKGKDNSRAESGKGSATLD